jgi:uncharacterized membrane protein
MSIAGLTMPQSERSSRLLLLLSLALNLFFIGAGLALLVQSGGLGGSTAPVAVDRSIAGRIERIAATLPPADGEKLRADYKADRNQIDQAHASYRRMQDEVRAALRAQPFDVAALRTAMTSMQVARQTYDRHLQDFFARLAPEISPAGRQRLADWRGSRREPPQPKDEAR